jgi:hypothetical protein
VFKDFVKLTINYSGELYFIVFNLFQECIPCFKNYLKAKTNFLAAMKSKPQDQDLYNSSLLSAPALSKSKWRYE